MTTQHPAARARRGWRLALLAALVCVVAAAAASRPAGALPTAAEVLQRAQRLGAGVRDYTVDIEIHFDVAGLRVPDAVVRLFHKRPDKTKLEPVRGFVIVPKGALLTGDPFARLGEGFTATLLGTATVAGRPAYHLRLVPRNGEATAAEVWIDRERWTVVKLRHHSPNGDPVTLEITYQRQQGKYWLPSRTVARLRLPAPPPAPAARRGSVPPPAPRAGSVTATFRRYRINTGLPDSLFVEKPAP